MAAKKTAGSNKTAHVLNMIAGDAKLSEQETTEELSPREPAAQAAAEGRPTPPILEVAKANDSALSEQIRSALEDEMPQAPPAPQPAAVEPPVIVSAAPPIAEQDPVLPVGETDGVESAPPLSAHGPEEDGELDYINVMQSLVEEKVDRYIKMFDLCTCQRCLIDVKALALTKLPAKYVVMRRGEMVPMLTVYEGRYGAAVTAQIIWACKTISQTPRHDR